MWEWQGWFQSHLQIKCLFQNPNEPRWLSVTKGPISFLVDMTLSLESLIRDEILPISLVSLGEETRCKHILWAAKCILDQKAGSGILEKLLWLCRTVISGQHFTNVKVSISCSSQEKLMTNDHPVVFSDHRGTLCWRLFTFWLSLLDHILKKRSLPLGNYYSVFGFFPDPNVWVCHWIHVHTTEKLPEGGVCMKQWRYPEVSK